MVGLEKGKSAGENVARIQLGTNRQKVDDGPSKVGPEEEKTVGRKVPKMLHGKDNQRVDAGTSVWSYMRKSATLRMGPSGGTKWTMAVAGPVWDVAGVPPRSVHWRRCD